MRNRLRNAALFAFASAALLIAVTSPAQAGGALLVCEPGVPFAYANGGQNIAYHPDLGYLGPLDNPTAVAQTDAGFAAWGAVPTSSASFVNGGSLPVDVDETNFLPWLNAPAPDGLSAIIYDEDGQIFDLLFGYNSGVLGFSSPEWGIFANCEITESYTFLNGGTILDGFPVSEFQCVQHHEFGHFINLAHTVVNEEIAAFLDYTGPGPHDTFGWPVDLVGKIETMSPFIIINGGQCDAHKDDAMSLSDIYPAPDYLTTTGTITGTILAPNGITQLTGVNVIARNVADPFVDAVSGLSSDRTDSVAQGDPYVGTYIFNNLTPGAQYAIYTDEIIAGGFSTTPMVPLPGPEEFYNGPDESSDPTTDDPSVYTTVPAAAGAPVSGVDIVFNAPGPGDPLPLGDDASLELFIPFTFEFCGESWSSLFVNSNGSVTFGSGDTDFSESASEMLSDQPRIAGLWDDLNPSAGGVVTFYQTQNEFIVSFQDVPEYPASGGNWFDIILSRSSNQVDIQYADVTSLDGLAGLSCGGGKTTQSEAESDLTYDQANSTGGSINARNVAAWYEVFTSLDNDLAYWNLRFNAPNEFRDDFEDNDTPADAKSVKIPFNSADRRGTSEILLYTEIQPVGGDIDFFKFTVDGGQTLMAEVQAGEMDSMLVLADETGLVVAFDDDGGNGLLSRIQYPVAEKGTYYLGVTTFPDYSFTGAGDSGGRYVLDIDTFTGTLLSLGDDSYEEVFFDGFTFPFQGTDWSSVFVNSNGNLTFGVGSTDWSESVSDLLNGPPRIAPLWDDLSPNNAGTVLVEQDGSSFTVTFDGVPEFISTGGNTFSVTLDASGEITIAYGATNGNDGIAGITEGGGAADPGEADLSSSGSWPGTGTVYEQFGLGEFDLDFMTLLFIP